MDIFLGGNTKERMKFMSFIKQIIIEAAHNSTALCSPDYISCRFQLLLFILLTGWTHHAPYCWGAILPQCSTTQHTLLLSRDLFLAICYLSECLLNNVVCLPLGHQCQDKSVASCWQEKWPPIGNNKQVPYYWPHHLSHFPHATLT